MKVVDRSNNIRELTPDKYTDKRSLSYHGWALKTIMENQNVIMNKLIEMEMKIETLRLKL